MTTTTPLATQPATSQAIPDSDWAGDWQGDTPSNRTANLAQGRQSATPQEGGKSFASWSTETLAQQCRMQARDQLDPEFSSFLEEVADRLAATPTPPTLSEDAAILAMSNAERAIERPDLPPLTELRMLAPEYERLRAMYRALAQVKAS